MNFPLPMLMFFESLVIIFIILCFVSAGLVAIIIRKVQKKVFFIGTSFFFVLFGISRIFYFIYDFVLLNNDIIWQFAAAIGIIAVICMLFVIEKSLVPGTKFIFTGISTVILRMRKKKEKN